MMLIASGVWHSATSLQKGRETPRLRDSPGLQRQSLTPQGSCFSRDAELSLLISSSVVLKQASPPCEAVSTAAPRAEWSRAYLLQLFISWGLFPLLPVGSGTSLFAPWSSPVLSSMIITVTRCTEFSGGDEGCPG